MKNRLLRTASICALALIPVGASAQQSGTAFAITVPSCGAETLNAGVPYALSQDTTGTLCTAGGAGGTSYTVNFGSAIGTKGTPGGFKDGSGNFQADVGDATFGRYLEIKPGSHAETLFTTPPTLGSTSGGWTPIGKVGITSTASAVLTAGAHQLGLAICDNANASLVYLQILDSATPTVGAAGVPFIPIPPTSSAGFSISLVGLQISNQFQVAATTAPNSTTAPGTAINCTFGYH